MLQFVMGQGLVVVVLMLARDGGTAFATRERAD